MLPASQFVTLKKEYMPQSLDRFNMVGCIDVSGSVVAFGGRVLDDSKPKYINTADTLVYKKGAGVFGLNFAKNSGDRRLILTEGYMDTIALHQAGFTNSIACLGTALPDEQVNLVSRYAASVVGDSDVLASALFYFNAYRRGASVYRVFCQLLDY